MYNKFIFFLLFVFFLTNFISGQHVITLKKNNFISIDDEINIHNIKKWSKQMNKLTFNPIYIYIDSTGGEVIAGLEFINNMNWLINQGKIINCIVSTAYSMAFVILQNCSNRYVMISATLMQHQMSLSEIKGSLSYLTNYLQMISSLSDELDISVSKRLGMDLGDYKNKIINDWWLTGYMAILHGIADEFAIVGCDQELYNGSTKQENLIFDINSNSNSKSNSKSNSDVKIQIIEDICPL